VILSPGIIHDTGPVSLNSTRMGFAWMTQTKRRTPLKYWKNYKKIIA